jgi:alpha-beta hydrolase superfamily lysophospholipase
LTGGGRHIHATNDNDVEQAYGRDPLFLKSTRTDAVYGLVGLMGQGANAASHLGELPVLLLYGGNDQLIPRAVTKAFALLLGPKATVKFYPEGYHMLLRDQGGATHAQDIAQWAEEIAQIKNAMPPSVPPPGVH